MEDECEYCGCEFGEIEPVEYDGHEFCGEGCMEIWMEQHGIEE